MFQTEDLVQESTGEEGFVPVQERHTECDELSSYRSIYIYIYIYMYINLYIYIKNHNKDPLKCRFYGVQVINPKLTFRPRPENPIPVPMLTI